MTQFSVWRDAFRALRTTPLVSALAILSLALGIGANTALFSIVDSLLLRSLPVRDPAALVRLEHGSWTHPIWEEIRSRDAQLFDGAFAWSAEHFDLADGGKTEFVDGAYVSGRLFDVLGVPPARGRTFTEREDARGGGPDGGVAVISHRFWQRRFAGDPEVVGRRLLVQRVPLTIIGVLAAGFSGPDVGRACDVYVPLGAEPLIRGTETFLDARSTWWLEIMVRLKPGQSADDATALLRGVQPQIRAATMPPQYPPEARGEYLKEGLTLVPAATGHSELRGRYQAPLIALMIAVGLVLLIACANIANLLLARASARRRELGVRLALGASRWRLAQMLLAESLLLSGVGALLGLVFAEWSSALLVRQLTTWRDAVFLDLSMDWRVLGFTTTLTVATALMFGAAPALGISSIAPREALQGASRSIVGDGRFGLRGALVVVQIALSLLLVVGAGVFLRTFGALTRVPLGFTPDPLVVVDVGLQTSSPPAAERAAFVERLREAAASAPGVTSASLSVITPLMGQGWNTSVGTASFDDRSRMSWRNATSPGWFGGYGMSMIAGRDFNDQDRRGAPLVAVVNESFARKFLGGSNVVTQAITLGGPGGTTTTYQVVGLVSDAVYRSPREGMVPTMFTPFAQQSSLRPAVSISVAAPGERAAAMRAVAGALTRVDPGIAFTFRTFDALVDATVAQERLVAMLSAFFGGLALLLAGIGLYGVMSYNVNRRRTEIGLRVALGASRGSVLRLVLGRTGLMMATGLVAGTGLSLWAARFVNALLFRVDARDPATIALAVAVLLVVGVTAAWWPARRAARLDPARVLRE